VRMNCTDFLQLAVTILTIFANVLYVMTYTSPVGLHLSLTFKAFKEERSVLCAQRLVLLQCNSRTSLSMLTSKKWWIVKWLILCVNTVFMLRYYHYKELSQLHIGNILSSYYVW
jgi:hypothetical protein